MDWILQNMVEDGQRLEKARKGGKQGTDLETSMGLLEYLNGGENDGGRQG